MLENIALKNITMKNNKMCRVSTFFLNIEAVYRYTVRNTAATPLNNAQPWWLFCACCLEVLYA